MTNKKVCVFCGARLGKDPKIGELTSQVAAEIAKNKMDVVCGGSNCGLMNLVAEATIKEGQDVYGVFPDILIGVEDPHPKLKELIRTPCLPSRKQKMVDISDAFVILPGGYGTLDEVFEIIVLRRLEANKKPIIFFNYNGFWNDTLKQINRMVEEDFIPAQEAKLFIVVNNLEEFKKVIKNI